MTGLKQHGVATVGELREFLEQMRGKSPQEMLGALAESGLIRATLQASVACVILIGTFTVVPYLLYGKHGGSSAPATTPPAAAAASPAAAAPAPTAAAPTAPPPADAAAGARPAAAGSGAPADLEKAAAAMGITETKTADPKNNPREKDLDSLLDKIK